MKEEIFEISPKGGTIPPIIARTCFQHASERAKLKTGTFSAHDTQGGDAAPNHTLIIVLK
jgi:hypothetical protein